MDLGKDVRQYHEQPISRLWVAMTEEALTWYIVYRIIYRIVPCIELGKGKGEGGPVRNAPV